MMHAHSRSMPIKALFIFGTRPEAIKLCPVILHGEIICYC